MKSIAIIPARAGSKRIPNKNIKEFFGKPIIAYSIEAALQSGIYDEVMVSTDSESIKEVALRYGAKVPFLRSKLNSNDYSTTVDVLLEVLEYYNSNMNDYQYATCIYACAPFVTTKLLKDSFRILREGYDCVFPALAYSHPIQRAFKISNECKAIPFFSASDPTLRTQDFPQLFHDAGMFYTFEVEKLVKNKSLLTDNCYAIKLEDYCAQDIDNYNDWVLAELKYQLFLK